MGTLAVSGDGERGAVVVVSDQGGDGWWQASDGNWYPPESHPDYRPPPGWWLASDGYWYPPEQHPDAEAAEPAAPTRTLATDLSRLWHERRGLSIGIVAGVAFLVIGIIGSLGGKDKPSRVTTSATTTRPAAALVQTVPATAATSPSTSTTTTTTTMSTTTTVVATTRAPATTEPTVPPATGSTASPVQQGVTPGAFCSPSGARGTTAKGTAMVCTTTATDSRNRWREG